MTLIDKLFRNPFNPRELLLLISVQPFLQYATDYIYRVLIPRPIYPHEYSYYSIIVRLVLFLLSLIFVSVLMFGTLRLTKKSDEARILKWVVYLGLIANFLCVMLAFYISANDLMHISPEYYPYKLNGRI